MIHSSDIKSIQLHGKDIIQNSMSKIEDDTRKNYFSLFPTEEVLRQSLPNSFVMNNPMNTVGGDGYWFYKNEGIIFLAVFDCMGHGHLASMMTRIYTSALKKLVIDQQMTFPNQILHHLHEEIKGKFEKKKNSQLGTGADFSIIRINSHLKEMEFSGAKMHLYEIADGELNIIKADRMQVGEFFDHEREYKTVIFDLNKKKNSKFYLFSDGLKDLVGGPNNKKFGATNVKTLLEGNYQYPMNEQKRRITKQVAQWQGSNMALDDVLLVGFSI